MKSREHLRTMYSRLITTFVAVQLLAYTTAFSQISVIGSTGLQTEINGSLRLELSGDWLSQGSLLPGTSRLELSGPYDQIIQQQQGAFYELTQSKSGGVVYLGSDINVLGNLSIINGTLELNGYQVFLDSNSYLLEMPLQTARGPLGYLSATRDLSYPYFNNVAGMGLVISSFNDFGMCTVQRGHAPQLVTKSQLGIARYFDIYPENEVVLPSLMEFRYDESELNGHPEEQLRMYGSKDHGMKWHKINGILDSASNSYVALINPDFNRLTLGLGMQVNQKVFQEQIFPAAECELSLVNWPNPFTHHTEVQFYLPGEAYIELVVVDMVGRLVKGLAAGNYQAGEHRLKFTVGSQADGIYFFRLQSHCGVISQKAVLNRRMD